MKRLIVLLLLPPVPAFALDLDFYTYDGFQETVDSFTRLALIFSDNDFIACATTFGIIGIVAGGVLFGMKAHAGQAANPIGWTLPILFGACIFKGAVIPTGTLYIYDPVINATQAVGGVPDIVVLLAGGLNALERGIVDIVDTANADPYGNQSGTLPYTLIMAAMENDPASTNLQRSAAQYYEDCGTLAIGLNANGASLQELKRETTDLATTFGKFVSLANQTVWYPEGNDAGNAGSCTDAWSYLQAQLNSPSSFADMEAATCRNAGFNTADPNQLNQCDADLITTAQLYGVTSGSSLPLLRSFMLAKSVSDAMQSGDFALNQSQIMNRQVMVESLGSSQAMNQWIPKLRAYMTAIIVGLVPLCALFLMTPLAPKALALVFGLFMWMFFWGIADAISAQMAANEAQNAFAQITQFHLGFDAIMASPDGAIKALGIFGKARAMGLTLSTLLSGSLLGFGGYALAQMGGFWQQEVERKGEDAARKAMLPEERAAFIQSLMRVPGAEAMLARFGFSAGSYASGGMDTIRSGSMSEAMINPELSGGNAARVLSRQGGIDAAQTVGNVAGTASAAQHEGIAIPEIVSSTTRFNREKSLAATRKEQQTLNAAGLDAYTSGQFQGGRQAADTAALLDAYEHINRTRELSADGLRRFGRQVEGTLIGTTAGVNTEDYIRNAEVMARKANAYAEFLDRHPGSENLLGRMGAVNDLVQSQGSKAVLDRLGMTAMVQGRAYSSAQEAESGRAATAVPGGLFATAHEVSRQAIAGQLAGAKTVDNIARLLGRDPDNLSDIIFTRTAQGNVGATVPITPETAEQILPRLEAGGLISSDMASYLRQTGRSGSASITMTVDGKPQGAEVVAGNRASIRQSSYVEEGESYRYFNNTTGSYDYSITGGMAVLEKGNIERELGKLYAGKGLNEQPEAYRFYALSNAVGTAMEQRGFSIRDTHFEQTAKNWGVGFDANVGFDTEKFIGIGGGLNVNGGGRYAQLYANNNDLSANGNTLLSAELIERSREQAYLDAVKVHGQAYIDDPVNAAALSAELLDRQADTLRSHINQVFQSETQETHKAIAGDPIHKAWSHAAEGSRSSQSAGISAIEPQDHHP